MAKYEHLPNYREAFDFDWMIKGGLYLKWESSLQFQIENT